MPEADLECKATPDGLDSQLAVPSARACADRTKDAVLEKQSGCAARAGTEGSAQALSSISRYGSNDQQPCRGSVVAREGQSERQALSDSLSIISKRALQFSMLADAIAGSDDATLGELAAQLHAPVPKLRMWGAS